MWQNSKKKLGSTPQSNNKQIETTLSANLKGRSTSKHALIYSQPSSGNRGPVRPKISAFQLQSKSITDNSVENIATHVQDINLMYIQLFHALFQKNQNIVKLFDDQAYMQGLFNKNSKLSREQRYQLQCMKMLKKTSQNIQEIKHSKQTYEKYKTITNYLKQNNQKQQQNNQKIPLHLHLYLIQKYKKISTEHNTLQQQHTQLIKSNQKCIDTLINININNNNNKSDNAINITKSEKQYKKSQQILSKIMNEQMYYHEKSKVYQKDLQQLQQKIKIAEQTKLGLQMKIISAQAQRDRAVRKARQKKQKSVSRVNNEEGEYKAVRSKSSIRFPIQR